ncbi:MAG: prepilin peptidase [Actinobacteria bacterium]|nr:MAG: prepilin peptidase [Actinomycetota bacterium]
MSAVVDAGVAVFFVAVLAVISVVDVKQRIVPNRIVLPAAAVVLAARMLVHPSAVWIVAGVGAAAFLLAAAIARPGGMGMGDVKLALLLGIAVGRTVPLALVVALVAALVPSVVLLVRHGPAGRTMGIPFAPFLALGGVVALFAGAPLG